MRLNEEFKAKRKALGITQADAARRLSVSLKTVQRIEVGSTLCRGEDIDALSAPRLQWRPAVSLMDVIRSHQSLFVARVESSIYSGAFIVAMDRDDDGKWFGENYIPYDNDPSMWVSSQAPWEFESKFDVIVEYLKECGGGVGEIDGDAVYVQISDGVADVTMRKSSFLEMMEDE